MNTKLNNEIIIKIKSVRLKGKKDKYEVTYYKDDTLESVVLLEDQIVNYRIIKDKEYTFNEWENIINTYNLSKWFEKCLNYISFKKRTIWEIKEYLIKGNVEENYIEEIITRLKKMHFLDDEDYAKSFLDETIRKNKGLKYFNYELTKRGIDQTIINKIALLYPKELIIEELIAKIQKEEQKLTSYPILYQKQKLTDKLFREGFSSNTISSILNNIKFQENIKERLKKEIEDLKKKTTDKNKITQKLLAKGYTYQDIKTYLK